MKPGNPTLLCVMYTISMSGDDQCSEFLKLWMAYHGFGEFPDLIKIYMTIGISTLLKEEYNTIENHTLVKDINNLMYPTQ